VKKSFIAVGGSLVLLLGACSTATPSASKFKSETEKFLKSNNTVKENFGQVFADASCTEPASNAVGTKYTCTGTGGTDGQVYNFAVEITSKSGYTVTDAQTATADTTPAATDTSPGASDTTPAAADTTPATTG
jgi:hypothetical protein